MNSSAFKWCIAALLPVITMPVFSQDTRAFNQNDSRSNRTTAIFNQNDSRSNRSTRAFNQNASRSNHTRINFSISPVLTNPVGSSDSLQFRGTGAGFTLGADYFMGRAALGFSAGFISSEADETAINNFISKGAIVTDQAVITKSRQQSMYLLLGPSIQFGNTILLEGHVKGGMFINNSGLVAIQQRGAPRAAYRNEPTDKSITPGFTTGIKVKYRSQSDIWSFGLGADYLHTKTNVVNYDARRGGGVEGLRLSQPVRDIVAGLTVTYSIAPPRDRGSGIATGKKHIGNVKYDSFREADAGTPAETACGPVTQVRTYPDGTKEEMTFSCPADAAAYLRGTNTTVPRQTQGASFGERVKSPTTGNNNTAPTLLRSISADADLDGDGVYETDVTATIVDEVEIGGKGDTPQQKAGISTSHSNVRTRSSLQAVTDDIYVSYGTAIVDGKEVMVKTVLKVKHDTVKNSVNNIR